MVISEKEYYNLCYKISKYETMLTNKNKDIEKYINQIDELRNQIDIAKKIINNLQNSSISVGPDGSMYFRDKFIKEEISKTVVKDIILSDTLQTLFNRTEEISNNFEKITTAIKKHDKISIDKSLEKEAKQQMVAIDSAYAKHFQEQMKTTQEGNDIIKQVLVNAGVEIADKVVKLPSEITYTKSPIIKDYSNYYNHEYKIKGQSDDKVYKLKKVITSDNTVKFKMVNIQLSADEYIATEDELIEYRFRSQINDVVETNTL